MTHSQIAKTISPGLKNEGYVLADHLGSTNGLANSSGTLTATNSYDSFGNATNSSFPTRYQYTGREKDSLTGLQYNRARWYNPVLGRFTSEDPIGFAGGDVNLYGYVNSNPSNRSDPLGLYDANDAEALRRAAELAAKAAATGGAGGLAAGALPYVVVGAAGLAGGAALGYYPGQWSANSPYNPLVYGPLNPWGLPYNPYAPQPQPIQQTTRPPTCQTTPKKPFYWTPPFKIPWVLPPRSFSDDDDPEDESCTKEWSRAYATCGMRVGDPSWKGPTGNYNSLKACAKGLVSQRCGGNRVF